MLFQISRDQIHVGLPEDLTILQPYVYLISFAIFVLTASILLKHFVKWPNMRSGLTCAVSLAVMYVGCVFIYHYQVPFLDSFIKPLPFMDLQEDKVILKAYIYNEAGKIDIRTFLNALASLFVLSFCVNQIYDYQQGNLKTLGWVMFRVISTFFCIGVNFFYHWFLEKLLAYIPADSFAQTALPYVPIVLMGGLLATFILGSMKKIIAKFFKMVNFTFDGLNGFYYTKKFGIMLTRGIWTTFFFSGFAFHLQRVCAEYSLPNILTLGEYTLGGMISLLGLFILWVLTGFIL